MAKKPNLDDFRVPYFRHGDGAKDGDAKVGDAKDGDAKDRDKKDGDKKAEERFALSDFDPAVKPFSVGSKDADRERLATIGAKLDAMQERLHAQRRQRVLLVLQGMDTSGKDGTVRGVFQDVNPLGLRIVPFRSPTPVEASHDFLWRVHAQAPAAGELTIFNRSHYEDVLVPAVLGELDDQQRRRRYEHIRHFEALQADSGTTIVKCMLHISKDEQRVRLQARIDDPTKHWKFDISDLDARKQWDAYQAAYDELLAATSTEYAPWYIIPADSKSHRNVMVAELMLRTFEALKLEFPPAKESLKGVIVE